MLKYETDLIRKLHTPLGNDEYMILNTDFYNKTIIIGVP